MTSIKLAAMGAATSASDSTVLTHAGILQAAKNSTPASSAPDIGLRTFMFSSLKLGWVAGVRWRMGFPTCHLPPAAYRLVSRTIHRTAVAKTFRIKSRAITPGISHISHLAANHKTTPRPNAEKVSNKKRSDIRHINTDRNSREGRQSGLLMV
jgi:hypothetical protein